MTADKQPGELLEVEPPIPEFPGDIANDQCLEHGWWNLMENCVFESEIARQLAEYWGRRGFDVRIETAFMVSVGEKFCRLWFRHAKVRR
jgi:hypothetical protein